MSARRALELLAVAVALAIFVLVVVAPNRAAPGYDLAPLAAAGRLVHDGQAAHLYDHHPTRYNLTGSPELDRAARAVGFNRPPTPFVYAPLVAWIVTPLAEIPFPRVMQAWTLLSTLFVLASLWLILRLYAPSLDRPLGWAAILLLATALEPVRYGFWLGQTTSLIFLLTVGALALARSGRHAAAGIALAIAAFVKLTPAAFALLWLWRGPRRAAGFFLVAGAALWGLSIAVAGWDLHLAYAARVRDIAGTVLAAYNDHGLPSFVSRFALPPQALADWTLYPFTPAARLVVTAIVATFAVPAIWLLARIPARDDARWRPLAEASVFVVTLLAPTIAWTHYFVALLAVVAALVGRGAHRRPVVAALIVAALALLSWPLLAPQERFVAGGLHLVAGPTYAALLLAAALLLVIRRSPT